MRSKIQSARGVKLDAVTANVLQAGTELYQKLAKTAKSGTRTLYNIVIS